MPAHARFKPLINLPPPDRHRQRRCAPAEVARLRVPARVTSLFWENVMLWLIVIILLIGWLLGVFVFDLGALLHILLVIAVIVLIVNLIRGRRVV